MRSGGWAIAVSTSQIIPLVLGDPARTLQLSAALREQGFWVPRIRTPSVPAGESLLRIGVGYGHTDDELDGLAVALECGRQML